MSYSRIIALTVACVLGLGTAACGDRHTRTATRAPSTLARQGVPMQAAGHETAAVDPALARMTYDERLTEVFRRGDYDGVVGGVVGQGPGRLVAQAMPGARVPQAWRDHDFTVESYTGRGPSPYAIGSKITLKAIVFDAVIDGKHLRSSAEGGEPPIQPGDRLFVLFGKTDLGGGNTASQLVVPRAGYVFVVRDGTVYPVVKAPPGVPPNLPQSVDQFLGHFRP
jgi:hypothetical protein